MIEVRIERVTKGLDFPPYNGVGFRAFTKHPRVAADWVTSGTATSPQAALETLRENYRRALTEDGTIRTVYVNWDED